MHSKRLDLSCKILGLVLAIALVACNTERSPCLEPLAAQLNVAAYQYVDSLKSYKDSALPNVNFVALDIDSASRWIIGRKDASKFALVLDPKRDTTRWVIQADSAVSPLDTLTFIYVRKLKFVSNACGYSYTFQLQQMLATRHGMDSAVINSYEVTTKAGTEHVRIYY